MALFIETDVRAVGRQTSYSRTAKQILNEGAKTTATRFDVFLSHSRLDAEVILGVKLLLESSGLTVYVDWVDDPQLDRGSVTPATAQRIRQRMRQSKSLFYAHSPNSTVSRWMPWELGYFDGFNANVAILPIMPQHSSTFKGEEYLGLYPYAEKTGQTIYIHRSISEYLPMPNWIAGTEKLRPL